MTHVELYILVRQISCRSLQIFHKTRHPDLKPSNILLLPSDVDTIVMHELAEYPSPLCELPKTIPPEEVPFNAVSSAPIVFDTDSNEPTELHWVITDFGHCT